MNEMPKIIFLQCAVLKKNLENNRKMTVYRWKPTFNIVIPNLLFGLVSPKHLKNHYAHPLFLTKKYNHYYLKTELLFTWMKR